MKYQVSQPMSGRPRGTHLISLGSLFSRKSAPLLGVDISSSSVKLVEVSQDKAGHLILERCAIEPLEQGWVVDGNIENFDEVVEAVRRLVRKSGARTKNVAMALPPAALITKRITLPGSLSEEELEMQVESEANQYIPFSLDEVSLDFCVVGPSDTVEGEVDVLIAAARKEKVQDRQGLAEAAGLTPLIIDVESFASRLGAGRLMDALPEGGADVIVALFEIGAQSTSMQVICNDEALYERDQTFGGAQLTQLIVRQYGFSFDEAETKKRSGELPNDYVSAVLEPFVESLAQEVGRALQFFFTSTAHHRVDRIMLAGGSAALPGLVEAVMRQSQVPCDLVDPFAGMALGSAVRDKKMLQQAPTYLTATGLAMRRFLQ